MEIRQPDILKIDASFVKAARNSEAGAQRLAAMVRLTQSLAPTVVLEGLEDIEDVNLAMSVGVRWVQGYYVGCPQNLALDWPTQ